MSIEESTLYLEQGGKMTPPENYIFIQRTGEEYELMMSAGIGDLLNSVYLIWEAIKADAAEMSDQDLYDLCGDFNVDYDVFRAQIRSNDA